MGTIIMMVGVWKGRQLIVLGLFMCIIALLGTLQHHVNELEVRIDKLEKRTLDLETLHMLDKIMRSLNLMPSPIPGPRLVPNKRTKKKKQIFI